MQVIDDRALARKSREGKCCLRVSKVQISYLRQKKIFDPQALQKSCS